MSHDFAVRLYAVSKLGAEVFITNSELAPREFADPHLFVHKDPTPPAPALAAASVTRPSALAQDLRTATDAAVGTAHDDKPAAEISTSTDTAPNEKPATESSVAADTAHNIKPAPEHAATSEIASVPKVPAEASPVADIANPPLPAPARPASVAPTPLRLATASPDAVPEPPRQIAAVTHISKLPIAIFISRKTAKIYVRQDFEPVFSAPITIEQPDQALGTFVFTALQYLPDQSGFVWNVVAMPAEQAKTAPIGKGAQRARRNETAVKEVIAPPTESPAEALARLEIPQDALDRISQMIVPGSSLILSDQGLGDETGEGTNFIVVTHERLAREIESAGDDRVTTRRRAPR
jgi:hypothetical protein